MGDKRIITKETHTIKGLDFHSTLFRSSHLVPALYVIDAINLDYINWSL